jgi:DNA primase
MRFSPSFLDDIRARLPVSQVVGRRVKLKREGREYVGLSPFKTEKSPSFTVNDQKGFYHCFSSGEHGDIFKFVMTTEGLDFPEVVERLAAEAGVALPRSSPEAERQHQERQSLQGLVEASASFFERQLAGSAGRDARAYLERRGVAPALQRQFRLGFAPDSRMALKDHLSAAGYSVADMIASGMLIGGEDIAVPYDRFRGRLMIPIDDAKGRVIAFGGRALQPDAKPKYLNSPETPLFHKGSVLFNAHRARAASQSAKTVIVVEGYLDVIALAGAGIAHAVAPLGTALTESQLGLLWRMAEDPILCFDGDDAGRKAAFRAIDTALPHLAPGASLALAFLPRGLDPDDLVRQQGPDAVQRVLDTARPLADVLWERELAAGSWTTPERRAQLEQRLRELTSRIGNPSVKSHYQMAMRERLSAHWRSLSALSNAGKGNFTPRNPAGNGGFASRQSKAGQHKPGQSKQSSPFRDQQPSASDALRLSVAHSASSGSLEREALLMRTLLTHVWLIDDVAEDVARLTLRAMPCRALRDGVLAFHARDPGNDASPLDRTVLLNHLQGLGLGDALSALQRLVTHRADRFAEPEADEASVRDGWQHTLAMHRRDIDLGDELEAAERAFRSTGSEEAWATIREIKQRIDLLDATGRPGS